MRLFMIFFGFFISFSLFSQYYSGVKVRYDKAHEVEWNNINGKVITVDGEQYKWLTNVSFFGPSSKAFGYTGGYMSVEEFLDYVHSGAISVANDQANNDSNIEIKDEDIPAIMRRYK